MARPVEYTEEMLINVLKNIEKENLSKRYLDGREGLPGSMTFIRKFGSWGKALEAAGLNQGLRTGRKVKLKNEDNKSFSLECQYDDDHVFFSKEYIYNYFQNHTHEDCINELIIPFMEFLYKYVEKYGWFFPKVPGKEDLFILLKKLNNNDGILSSSSFLGIKEIKGHFISYWDSFPKHQKKPCIELFFNRDILFRLLKYRFGVNNSKKYTYCFSGQEVEFNELFDISFKQIRKAFEVNHYTSSIFKPLLAKWIYKRYGFDGMTTWDPCFGFAGRLLGFISCFENGKYIGSDPNFNLYLEMQDFVNLTECKDRVELYNLPMENMELESIDFVFTCPPYFDLEVYCNESTQSIESYKERKGWLNGFLKPLATKSYNFLKPGGKAIFVIDNKNVFMLQKFCLECGFKLIDLIEIKNNKTHLTKKETYEFIIVLEK